ncbi:MAG: hypothetical protein JW917_08305 [Ignavibacteria bacterium]|nr:hypothetical protein [Ignavibacteria bacterium]
MKIVFAVIVSFHGIIHLLGFIKGFKLAEVDRMTGKISKLAGMFWLFALLLFLFSIIAFLFNKDWWWMTGIIAVIISQILMFTQWQDAKFGSVANILIFIVLIFGFAEWNFNCMVKKELKEFLPVTVSEEKILTEDDVSKLPSAIRKWMYRSNVLGKPVYQVVNVKQIGEMRTTPDSKWLDFEAEQWFTTSKPGFLWKANVSLFPGIFMTGRDKLINYEGSMLIKILSVFTVVDSKGNKINQGTFIRYIGENVWFPYAVSNEIYSWEEIDPVTARITLMRGNINVSGVFKFTEEGDFLSFEALRYYEREEGGSLENWLVTADENSYREFQGIRVPAKLSVIWKLKDGDFNWLNLEITDISFK